ncbi:MAG: hypothetical protein QM831_17010 [Kofleriaceae bacterium]
MKSTSSKQVKKDDRFVADVTFHPRAPAARLVVDDTGELHVKALTSPLGPGYHQEVLAKLAPVLDELDFVWAEEAPDPARAMCEWLVGVVQKAGDDQVLIGLSDARSFISDAPVLTALGPRDPAWRDAVIADPMKALDAFAWPTHGPGYRERADALLAMWQEVPWREPMDDSEHMLMERVEADLAAAAKAGAKDLPYPEWSLLLDFLGRDDAESLKIRKIAGDAPTTIGYRRLDMEIALSGGWSVQIPASFAGRWEDDGGRYLASDGERAIEFTSLTADGETDSQKLLDVAPPKFTVIDTFETGSLKARAEISDEDDIHIVHGLVAAAPHVAILTLKGRKSDEPWALKTLRSLVRSEP